MKDNKKDNREDFCPPCLAAIPLAFAATSTGASVGMEDGSNNSGKNKLKRTLLLVGVTIGSLVLTFLFIWFMFFKKKCTTCK
jgi:hypothetical protein